MNTTAWEWHHFDTEDEVTNYLSNLQNEWNALNSKVVFTDHGWIVFTPVPMKGERP